VTVRGRLDDPIYLYVVRPRIVPKPPVIIYLYDYQPKRIFFATTIGASAQPRVDMPPSVLSLHLAGSDIKIGR
jgi:hypothetical protein